MATRRRPIKLTKKKAALIQIEAAIRHFRAGRWVEAVTLAGAAEHCLPAIEGAGIRALVAKAKQRFADKSDLGREAEQRGIKTDKDVVRAVNLSRDWLKHCNASQPAEWEIEPDEALFMIFRAVTVYDRHKGKSTRLLAWFRIYLGGRVKALMDKDDD